MTCDVFIPNLIFMIWITNLYFSSYFLLKKITLKQNKCKYERMTLAFLWNKLVFTSAPYEKWEAQESRVLENKIQIFPKRNLLKKTNLNQLINWFTAQPSCHGDVVFHFVGLNAFSQSYSVWVQQLGCGLGTFSSNTELLIKASL